MPRVGGMLGQEKPAEEILSARQWIRVGGTPVPLSSDAAGANPVALTCREALLQADPVNAGNITIGAINAQVGPPAIGTVLAAGASIVISIRDLSRLYINGPNANDAVLINFVR